jgi:hypothetical protein
MWLMHVVYFVVDTALIIRKDELSKPTMNLFQILARIFHGLV